MIKMEGEGWSARILERLMVALIRALKVHRRELLRQATEEKARDLAEEIIKEKEETDGTAGDGTAAVELTGARRGRSRS